MKYYHLLAGGPLRLYSLRCKLHCKLVTTFFYKEIFFIKSNETFCWEIIFILNIPQRCNCQTSRGRAEIKQNKRNLDFGKYFGRDCVPPYFSQMKLHFTFYWCQLQCLDKQWKTPWTWSHCTGERRFLWKQCTSPQGINSSETINGWFFSSPLVP